MTFRLAAALSASLLAATFLAGVAMAETASMTRDIEGVGLHDGPHDMVAYYRAVDGGALEVTATFLARDADGFEPQRIVMALGDGDDVSFAMPGYPQALYRFARVGSRVIVSVRPVRRTDS
jgi:hypothetical protein